MKIELNLEECNGIVQFFDMYFKKLVDDYGGQNSHETKKYITTMMTAYSKILEGTEQ